MHRENNLARVRTPSLTAGGSRFSQSSGRFVRFTSSPGGEAREEPTRKDSGGRRRKGEPGAIHFKNDFRAAPARAAAYVTGLPKGPGMGKVGEGKILEFLDSRSNRIWRRESNQLIARGDIDFPRADLARWFLVIQNTRIFFAGDLFLVRPRLVIGGTAAKLGHARAGFIN